MSSKNLKTLSDEELAQKVKLGNQNAMGELYDRYHILVFSKCLSFSKNTDDANDLSQDVMIKVMEKIISFKGESKFSTWLYAVTFNYCTDYVRKTKRKYFESINSPYDIADLSTTENEVNEEHTIDEDLAGKALSEISENDQQLLLMKYRFNKSIQELQGTYRISASAVKMRLLRARSKAVARYGVIAMQPTT